MRLEVGKYYKTRDGRKVGPAKSCAQGAWDTRELLVEIEDDKSRLYRAESGVRLFPEYGGSDIIAEWDDRVQLKAGTYHDGYGDRVEIRDHTNPRWPFTDGKRYFDENGRFSGDNRRLDLVLAAGPVRTVTRREVVPGVWSGVVIERPTVAVNLHVHFSLHDPSNDELRAAAAVLLELAGALPDGE